MSATGCSCKACTDRRRRIDEHAKHNAAERQRERAACNSSHCHCPSCERERQRQHDDECVRQTKSEYMQAMRDEARERSRMDRAQYDYECRRERNRVHSSLGIRWRWRCLPRGEGWIKMNVDTGRPFGVQYERVEFTPRGFRARNPIVTENGYKEESLMSMTPLKLSILLWRWAHLDGRPYPIDGGSRHKEDYLRGQAEKELAEAELISLCGPSYYLTERAKVLLKVMLALPLPVRADAPWVMPEKPLL